MVPCQFPVTVIKQSNVKYSIILQTHSWLTDIHLPHREQTHLAKSSVRTPILVMKNTFLLLDRQVSYRFFVDNLCFDIHYYLP